MPTRRRKNQRVSKSHNPRTLGARPASSGGEHSEHGRSLSLRIRKTPHACRAGVPHPPPDAECPLGSCSSHSRAWQGQSDVQSQLERQRRTLERLNCSLLALLILSTFLPPPGGQSLSFAISIQFLRVASSCRSVKPVFFYKHH